MNAVCRVWKDGGEARAGGYGKNMQDYGTLCRCKAFLVQEEVLEVVSRYIPRV